MKSENVYQFWGFLFMFFVVEASLLDDLFANMFEGNAANQTVDGQALEAQAVEAQKLDGQAVDGQVLEARAEDGQALDAQALNAQALDGQALEAQALEAQALEAQAVDGLTVDERADYLQWDRKVIKLKNKLNREESGPSLHYNVDSQQAWWPPTEPKIGITPVKVVAVVKTEMLEKNVNEVNIVPFTIGKTTCITITETATIPTTLVTRSTRTVPPQPLYKTHTHILDRDHVVDGVDVITQEVLVFETELEIRTDTLTTTLHTTKIESSFRKEYVEEETTVTVWQPYTVTTTGMTTYTETVNIPIELWREHVVRIPIVEVRTETLRLPHTKTVTDWETHTTTSTMCTNRQPGPPRW